MGNNEDAMAHLAPGQGSFGSAGASRSLRKTATAAGSGHTATVMALKPNTLPVQMDEPSVEDIWRSIKLMQCCWCNDTRTFQSLSQHWTRSHGMDLQSIRDRLQVPKNYSFISNALKSVFVTRSKKFYNPNKLKFNGGLKVISEYGRASNLAKLAAIPPDQREEARLRGVQIAVKNREAITRQYELDHPCIICGAIFTRITYHATTCSKTCNEVRRLAKADRSPHPERRLKRICKVCSAIFTSEFDNRKGLTCSSTCEKTNRSSFARGRTAHRALMKKRQAEERAKQPKRFCSMDGCSKPHLAKGLCSPHYQQNLLRIHAA